MLSPIKLERTIPLQQWRVTGSIAVATKREWEPAVLQLATQVEVLTPEIVVEELLGGRSGIARRLLDICTGLGLLEAGRGEWRATEAGRQAAATGIVLLPQRGVWSFYTAADPLLAHGVVAVFPWSGEPSAFDERGKDTGRSFDALPATLAGAVGRVLDVPAGPVRAIRIDDLGKSPRGERVETTDKARITWTLDPKGARCRLTGRVEDDAIDAELPVPAPAHEQVWQSLLRHAGLEPQWDPQRRVLRVPFKETKDDEERSRMMRALLFTTPLLDGLGRFDDTRVDGVGLQARSPEDATSWARWRFLRELRSYSTDDMIQDAYRRAADPFEGVAAPCPPRSELARLARGDVRPPPSYWWLQAPEDWGMTQRRAQ